SLSPDRRARVPRRPVALSLLPEGPLGPAARCGGMGHPRHLQRPALDPSAGCVPLIRLVGRRLLGTLPTLRGALVVAFLLLNVAPGDPVAARGGDGAE